MLRRWLTLRALLGIASIALIVAGIAGMVDLSATDRPSATWSEVEALSDRSELNVVFVMIDTLRSDRLGAYGYERDTSPVFDALAESGILFRNVMAQSTWTKSSMASQWTATYPSTNRVTRYPHGLPEDATTPAEILQEQGYRTVGIWRNGWVAPNFGFDQGFDLYYKPETGNDGSRRGNPSAATLPGTDMDITNAALEFLRGVGSDPFFLYLHYMDVHQYVYDGSADFGTTYSDIYDNSIHWVDKNLGAVVSTLQEEGLMKNTILVVNSDHAEAFGEHGVEGHARNLYRETTRVPFLIALPRRLEEGIEVRTPVENLDLWPTVLDLMGMPALPASQGRSLMPLIDAAARGKRAAEGAEARFSHLDQTWGQADSEPEPHLSVATDGYRLFHWPEQPGRSELYHVETDPYEQRDIAEENPELVASLAQRIEEHRDAPAPSWGSPEEVSLDKMELQQLRALGYAVGGDSSEEKTDDAEEIAPEGTPPGARE